ncbi:MAG: hypothetical protein ABIP55_17415, partial [Tepidisphaeraceae bacterium]
MRWKVMEREPADIITPAAAVQRAGEPAAEPAASGGAKRGRARLERRLGLGRAGPVALIATILPVSGSVAMLAVGPLLAPWLREQGMAGVVGFTIVFAILGALALAPTYST